MDFLTVLKVKSKRTGEIVERARMICTHCDCKNSDEFEREYAEDMGDFMRSHLLKGNYPEIAFDFCFFYSPVVVDGETIRFRGADNG